jgi:hypothetical protein
MAEAFRYSSYQPKVSHTIPHGLSYPYLEPFVLVEGANGKFSQEIVGVEYVNENLAMVHLTEAARIVAVFEKVYPL